MKSPSIIIVVRAIFYKNNKYYPQVFLDECLYKLETRTEKVKAFDEETKILSVKQKVSICYLPFY